MFKKKIESGLKKVKTGAKKVGKFVYDNRGIIGFVGGVVATYVISEALNKRKDEDIYSRIGMGEEESDYYKDIFNKWDYGHVNGTIAYTMTSDEGQIKLKDFGNMTDRILDYYPNKHNLDLDDESVVEALKEGDVRSAIIFYDTPYDKR